MILHRDRLQASMETYDHENNRNENLLMSNTKSLKARILQSASKQKVAQLAPSESQASLLPNQSKTVMTTPGNVPFHGLAKQDPGVEMRETLANEAEMARRLCATGHIKEARQILHNLVDTFPRIHELADFWCVAMDVERGDARRSATCILLALDQLPPCGAERDAFNAILRRYLVESGTSYPSHLAEFFETPEQPERRQLSFCTKADEVEPNTDVLETEIASTVSQELPTQPSPTFLRYEDTSKFSLKALLDELPKTSTEQVQSSGRNSLTRVFGTPSRVPAPPEQVKQTETERLPYRLESRSPARQKSSSLLFGRESSQGSIIVLSPVKQKSGAKHLETRVATPVRRSMRVSTTPAEVKNRDALREARYSYQPNKALVDDSTIGPQTPQDSSSPIISSERRKSTRRKSSVERLEPKLKGKSHN